MKAGWQTKTFVVLTPDKIIRGQAAAGTHSSDNNATVILANAGIQQLKNAFCLNSLDSLRSLSSNGLIGDGNGGALGGAR